MILESQLENNSNQIIVFDSGLGGLSVFSELLNLCKGSNFTYIADYEAFPYGRLKKEEILARLNTISEFILQKQHIDIFVIACNTASTAALLEFRKHMPFPIVGVVPPIKPAASLSKSKIIGLLGTEATVKSPYTKDLIEKFASDCKVISKASPELVFQAEQKLCNGRVDLDKIKNELTPFLQEQAVDAIALSCTHFPHLLDEFKEIGLGHIHWTTPSIGAAKQTLHILSLHKKIFSSTSSTSRVICFGKNKIAKKQKNFLEFAFNQFSNFASIEWF